MSCLNRRFRLDFDARAICAYLHSAEAGNAVEPRRRALAGNRQRLVLGGVCTDGEQEGLGLWGEWKRIAQKSWAKRIAHWPLDLSRPILLDCWFFDLPYCRALSRCTQNRQQSWAPSISRGFTRRCSWCCR